MSRQKMYNLDLSLLADDLEALGYARPDATLADERQKRYKERRRQYSKEHRAEINAYRRNRKLNPEQYEKDKAQKRRYTQRMMADPVRHARRLEVQKRYREKQRLLKQQQLQNAEDNNVQV